MNGANHPAPPIASAPPTITIAERKFLREMSFFDSTLGFGGTDGEPGIAMFEPEVGVPTDGRAPEEGVPIAGRPETGVPIDGL